MQTHYPTSDPSRSLRAVSRRGAHGAERRNGAVARQPGSLRVIRGGDVFEDQGDAARVAFHANGVRVDLEARVGHDLEARPLGADASERQHRGDVYVLRKM